MTKLGSNLKDIRVAAKLSVRQAGKKIKINYNQYHRYELGLNNPNVEMISKIAKGFGLSPREELELFFAAEKLPPAIIKYLIGNVGECKILLHKVGVILK